MLKLPRVDKEGNSYLSYSAIKAWREEKGFNTGLLGKYEFMMNYFFGEEFGDEKGWAEFGKDIESYIVERGSSDKFTDREKAILDTIKPLGVFQQEIKIPFNGFYIKGFIDDLSPTFKKVRDYKSASKKSGEKYYKPEYDQLDLYCLGVEALKGFIPDELEVVIVERKGNPFKGGGRSVLEVADNVWYVKRETSPERLEKIKQDIQATANEISKYYSVFLKLNS